MVKQRKQKKTEVPMSSEVQVETLNQELDLVRVELEKTRREIQELQLKKNELVLATHPRRELSEEEKVINDKLISGRVAGESLKSKIEAEKAYDNVKVTGRFMNRRAPGNPAKLTYMKYADDPVKWYTFNDGAVYTIPRGFADQINEYYHRPRFIQKDGPLDPGNPSQIHDVDTSNKSYAFVPTTF